MDFDYVVMPGIILVVAALVSWLIVRRMRSLSKRSYSGWRKLAERIVLSIVVFLAVAVAGYSSFNAIAIHHFWARNPPPGEIVAVGGIRHAGAADLGRSEIDDPGIERK